MKNHTVIAIDLAKSVFQVCVLRKGIAQQNRRLSRARLLAFVAQPQGDMVVMEACYSAHYWARCFQHLGLAVRLIPAQHVKPFVRIRGIQDTHRFAMLP